MSQGQRSQGVSKIKDRVLKEMSKRGQRLMIIKLRKYNKVGELLIEIETTGFQGHMSYQDTGVSARALNHLWGGQSLEEFSHWLQLVHCADLLMWCLSISYRVWSSELVMSKYE